MTGLPAVVVPFDPAWSVAADALAAELRAVLSPVARRVEHIGSTAVPGLAAKPIVDMCAVVADIDDVADRVAELSRVGWVAAPEPSDIDERRRSYCTPSVEWRTHHLHVVEEESHGWKGWLAFRDYLRLHPDDAAAYADLKRSLAGKAHDPNDRSAYRLGKSGFIQDHTRSALEP